MEHHNETAKTAPATPKTGEPAAAAQPAQAASQEPPKTDALTAEQIEALKSQAAKTQENWDRFVRLNADFDNYKKRAARERQDAVKFANEGLLARLIPVLDNFEMALVAASSDNASAKSVHDGVTMIQSQLKSVLAEAGLEEIDATSKLFDPNFHEAVAQKETAEVPEDHVVQQIRKGYKYRDKLIRAAAVIVAKKP